MRKKGELSRKILNMRIMRKKTIMTSKKRRIIKLKLRFPIGKKKMKKKRTMI